MAAGKRFPGGLFIEAGAYLRAGGRIELRPVDTDLGSAGDNSTALEVRSLELDWIRTVGPDDLLEPVRFRPAWSIRAQPGFLHATAGDLTLRGPGGVFLSSPLASLRALAPPWRARLLRLRSGGAGCTVLLGGARGFGTHDGSAETGILIGMGADSGLADPLGAAVQILGDIGAAVSRLKLRRQWTSVLRGKCAVADLAAERRELASAAKKSRYGRVQ